MLIQDIVDRSRYGHHGLRSDGRPAGPPTATTVHTPDRPSRPGSQTRPTGAPNSGDQRHASSGWGEAPLDLEHRAGVDLELAAGE
ncbi:MAG: hypothetical protein ACREQ5_20210, partial [Candidatus Dormibacteria bacterium]